jgi:protoporphyrinogen oxidase
MQTSKTTPSFSPDQGTTLVVGAGLSGLTAGTLLAEAGVKCLLVEKEKSVGGASRSQVLDGIVFDMGPHVFQYRGEPSEKFMMDLLKGEKVIKRRFRCAIHSKGRDWKFPVSLADMLMYPWVYKKQMLSGFLKKKKLAKRHSQGAGAVSVEDEIIDKVGPAYYEDVFAKMLTAKTSLSGDKLHLDWLARVDRDVNNRKEPFVALSHTGLLKKVTNAFYQTYYYPFNGFQVIPDKLHERYQRAGGATILDCGPIRLEKTDNRIVSATVRNETVPVRKVVWTGSVNGLNRALTGKAPEIRYIKSILVFLTYNRAKPVKRPCVYIYYAEKDLIFNRVYYPYSIYREHAPQGKEGICLELNYFSELDHIDDEEIVRRTVEDVYKIKLFNPSDLRYSRVIRLGESIPLYDLDYESKMEEAYREVRAYSNLYSVGRQGGYFFCLSPAAVLQGMKMADYVIKKRLLA